MAYQIGTSNNNKLIFDALDETVKKRLDAYQLVHSGCGYKYTSEIFRSKLKSENGAEYVRSWKTH